MFQINISFPESILGRRLPFWATWAPDFRSRSTVGRPVDVAMHKNMARQRECWKKALLSISPVGANRGSPQASRSQRITFSVIFEKRLAYLTLANRVSATGTRLCRREPKTIRFEISKWGAQSGFESSRFVQHT